MIVLEHDPTCEAGQLYYPTIPTHWMCQHLPIWLSQISHLCVRQGIHYVRDGVLNQKQAAGYHPIYVYVDIILWYCGEEVDHSIYFVK